MIEDYFLADPSCLFDHDRLLVHRVHTIRSLFDCLKLVAAVLLSFGEIYTRTNAISPLESFLRWRQKWRSKSRSYRFWNFESIVMKRPKCYPSFYSHLYQARRAYSTGFCTSATPHRVEFDSRLVPEARILWMRLPLYYTRRDRVDVQAQSFGLSAIKRRKEARMVLLNLSVFPFSFGWYVVVKWGFTPRTRWTC